MEKNLMILNQKKQVYKITKDKNLLKEIMLDELK